MDEHMEFYSTSASPLDESYHASAEMQNKKRRKRRLGNFMARVPVSPSFSSEMQTRDMAAQETDDEEAVRQEAALVEQLPSPERLRRSVLVVRDGKEVVRKQVEVTQLSLPERQAVVQNLLKVPDVDHGSLLQTMRARFDRVGIQVPSVEVRFRDLTVKAKCHVGDTAIPTLWNATKDFIGGFLSLLRVSISTEVELGILKEISGVLKPSRMTLLLGPPGSGKSTLLKALADQLDSNLQVKGEISYNGHRLEEFIPKKTSSYVSQHDVHLGEMTVRETLDFSTRCQGTGHKYEMLKELSSHEREADIPLDAEIDLFMKATATPGIESSLQTDYILKLLALDICADTIVGNNLIRGISGGQKKRLTTGEIIMGPTKALFMDEISTGLDTSTTYQIVKCISQLAHHMDFTILMSLLQPAPETYELFDHVLLLSEGHIVYHGPREQILEFFKSCGFVCPRRKGAADFLQEVLSQKDQGQYWHNKEEPYYYVTAEEFSRRYAYFHVGESMQRQMFIKFDKSKDHKASISHKDSMDKIKILRTCFSREVLLIKRNAFLFVFKTGQIIFMSFVAMTVYIKSRMHRRDEEDGNQFVSALSFGLLMNMFNSYSEISYTLFRIPVFFKQRSLLFFPAWAYTLPALLTRLPISMFEAVTWVGLTYYSIGFAPAPSRFFKQLLLIFALNQMASSLFRFVASVSRTIIISGTVCPIITFLVLMLGGMITPRSNLPKWWAWGYWLSPLTYAQNAITVNEFLAPQWNHPTADGSVLGLQMLKLHDVPAKEYWYWLGTGVLLATSLVLDGLFVVALTYIRAPGRTRGIVSKKAIEEAKNQHKSMKTYNNILTSIDMSSIPDLISSSFEQNKDNQQFSQQTPLRRMDDAMLRVASRRIMSLPFQPLTMSFRDVTYSIDSPQGGPDGRLQLLNGITGAFRPGVLTALMGASGAGKTTLLDVLAGRKTGGYIEGDIRISGFPKKQETFARISGYCEQNDIHSPQVTVYESLIFSAWLRLSPQLPPHSKQAFINDVMELVELEDLRDTIVGIPGLSGLSTEQRKRLTIAVELVANPSIIFMDEPTSGLDARSAAIVMRTIRNAVDTGRTIVCTIHQPSIDIFEAFDELLLLKAGGQMIYAGPLGKQSAHMIHYFQGIPGVPRIKNGYNPATWMLEVTSPSVETTMKTDFSAIFQKSKQFGKNEALVQGLSVPGTKSKDLAFETVYAQSMVGQTMSCLWKQHLAYWRSPEYNCNRMLFTFVIALIIGTVFWDAGSRQSTEEDLQSILGAMYGAVIFIGITNCNSVQPVVALERTVFYRERGAGMYSSIPYAMTHVIMEVPYVFVQTVMYSVLVYSMMHLSWEPTKFLWFFFTMFFTLLSFTYYGMMAVAITPSLELAAVVASTFYSLFNLFSGFFIPKPRIPGWWIWYYWLCPVAWSVYGVICSQYGDVNDSLILSDGSTTTIKLFVENELGFQYEFLWIVATVLVAFTVLFGAIYTFTVRHFNFQNR